MAIHGTSLRPLAMLCILVSVLSNASIGCSPRVTTKSTDQPDPKQLPAVAPANEKLPVLATLPDFSLVDQTGRPFGSTELWGKVWVANFIFTRCTNTCPRQTAEMAALQGRLDEQSAWEDVRLVSITVDPEHDSPEVLADYAQRHGANTEHWRFLTGLRDVLWALSKRGFKLDVGEAPAGQPGPFFHSPRFVLVDRLARVRGVYDSTDEDSRRKLAADLARVLAEPRLRRVAYPEEILDPPWLEGRRQLQLGSVGRLKVPHDFQFTDRVQASGITFRNQIVDDAGKDYKAVHYDHGNGLAVADVDGDGLLDLYFTTQLGPNELWKNLGGGRFANLTSSALALADKVGVTASFADTDNDGDPDLYVTTVDQGNHLLVNDGRGNFTDATEPSGLGHVGHSSSAVFFDYDRDGLVDLFLCNVGVYTSKESGRGGYRIGVNDAFAGHLKPEERNERSLLFRNTGGNRFVDVTAAVGLDDTSWTGDASPLDANGDGWPDLYVLNMQGHDEYYQNVEGKRFERKSRELFPKTPWGAMGIKVFDYNNDGRMDVMITDMHSDMSEEVGPNREKLKSNMKWTESLLRSGGMSIFGNALFRAEADGRFREVSDTVGAENYWPWGLSVGDLNADGFLDVLITSSMNFKFRYGVNSVLLNNRGHSLVDCEFILGVEPRREGRTAKPWFVLDCAGADRDHKLVEQLKLTEPAVMWGALGTRSSAIFDLDDDGDLDIVTNEFNDGPMLLLSNLSEKRPIRYLKVKLIGSRDNRGGLGATVKLHAGEHTYTQVHDGQSGYLSQSDVPLYFGLASAASVDRIDVVWPSGQAQSITGPIDVNQTFVIRQPADVKQP